MSLSSPVAPQEPIWREPQRPAHVGTVIAAILGITLGIVALVAVALYLLGALGATSFGVAASERKKMRLPASRPALLRASSSIGDDGSMAMMRPSASIFERISSAG